MAVSNPYDYAHPVRDPAMFAGRGKIVADIDYCLSLTAADPPQYKNFAITGKRGIGKTSLLSKVVDLAETRHALMAVRIELDNDLAENHARLFHQIISELQYRLGALTEQPKWWGWLNRFTKRTRLELEVNLFVGKLKAAERDNADLPQALLSKGLEQLLARANEEGFPAIAICIDEANLLAKNETGLQAIRNAFQKQQGYLLFLAGTSELLNELGTVFGPIQRFFDQIPLGPLPSAQEVRQCLELALPAGEQHRVTQDFADAVFGLTGGHPYGVKLAAFHAYRAMQQRGWSVMRLIPEVENMALEGMQHLDSGTLSEDYTPFVAAEDDGEPTPHPARESSADETSLIDELETITADELEIDEVEDEAQLDEAPVVKLVSKLISDGLRREATDLFIRPQNDGVAVREKVDAAWTNTALLPKTIHQSLIARLKIIGNLDIAERRVPQQGKVRLKIGDKEIALSLHVTPSIKGETAHLRFQRQQPLLSLGDIGFTDEQIATVNRFLTEQKGMWLVAGNSDIDCGAVLAAATQALAESGQQVFSIGVGLPGELPEITQFDTNPRAGATTHALLNGLLQQTPDTLIVAGVEDSETAQKLARAAMRGHRIVVGLVADDPLDALQRWQRLVNDAPAVANSLKLLTHQTEVGNADLGVELVNVDDDIRAAVHRQAGIGELRTVVAKPAVKLAK